MKSKMFATIMMTTGQHEAAEAERPRRADVDEDADERQRVRVNPERHAQR